MKRNKFVEEYDKERYKFAEEYDKVCTKFVSLSVRHEAQQV